MRTGLPTAGQVSAAFGWAFIVSAFVIAVPFGVLALALSICQHIVEFILITFS
jgi:hypothetical protein